MKFTPYRSAASLADVTERQIIFPVANRQNRPPEPAAADDKQDTTNVGIASLCAATPVDLQVNQSRIREASSHVNADDPVQEYSVNEIHNVAKTSLDTVPIGPSYRDGTLFQHESTAQPRKRIRILELYRYQCARKNAIRLMAQKGKPETEHPQAISAEPHEASTEQSRKTDVTNDDNRLQCLGTQRPPGEDHNPWNSAQQETSRVSLRREVSHGKLITYGRTSKSRQVSPLKARVLKYYGPQMPSIVRSPSTTSNARSLANDTAEPSGCLVQTSNEQVQNSHIRTSCIDLPIDSISGTNRQATLSGNICQMVTSGKTTLLNLPSTSCYQTAISIPPVAIPATTPIDDEAYLAIPDAACQLHAHNGSQHDTRHNTREHQRIMDADHKHPLVPNEEIFPNISLENTSHVNLLANSQFPPIINPASGLPSLRKPIRIIITPSASSSGGHFRPLIITNTTTSADKNTLNSPTGPHGLPGHEQFLSYRRPMLVSTNPMPFGVSGKSDNTLVCRNSTNSTYNYVGENVMMTPCGLCPLPGIVTSPPRTLDAAQACVVLPVASNLPK